MRLFVSEVSIFTCNMKFNSNQLPWKPIHSPQCKQYWLFYIQSDNKFIAEKNRSRKKCISAHRVDRKHILHLKKYAAGRFNQVTDLPCYPQTFQNESMRKLNKNNISIDINLRLKKVCVGLSLICYSYSSQLCQTA